MEGSLRQRVLGLECEDQLAHLFSAVQHLGGLATDEEAALRFWLGAAYSKYEEAASNRDLEQSVRERDIERWHGICERLEDKSCSYTVSIFYQLEIASILIVVVRERFRMCGAVRLAARTSLALLAKLVAGGTRSGLQLHGTRRLCPCLRRDLACPTRL